MKFSLFKFLSFFIYVALVFSASTLTTHALEGDDLFCLYSKPNLKGRQQCGAQLEVNWVGWRWYRSISSIEVKEGYELVGFNYLWQTGSSEIFSGKTRNLGAWNNRIVSFYIRPVVVEQDEVCFYSRKNFRGERFCTSENLSWLGWYWNNRISSVSIPSGFQVKLYNRWGFYGQSITLTTSTPNLRALGFNNKTSSFQISEISVGNDADSDGVNDSIDLCPNTLLGQTVDANGCAPNQLDTDNDGINDAADQCPSTAADEIVNEQGCALSQLDSDGDNVNDALDQCPSTPIGEPVDEQGCSASQKDSDADGVNDASDQCSATPNGEQVNAIGCSLSQLDSDNDQVNDALDQCPNTPSGEVINEQGCSASQLDADNDGVSDALDQCPSTPAGETSNGVGCSLSQLDSDNDSVNDAVDQCSATPIGESVNADGCALSQLDSDNDSVNDALDQCPSTPAGETVNAEGCAPSQLDSDGDSVNDALDQCPATPVGEVANPEGCAPSQLDTDNDTVNDALDQCPTTPETEVANEQGCAPSQLDTDSDGVNDDLDLCADTPEEETANAEGCAPSQLDTDNDGANNAIDQCPATPAEETANDEGCAPSQLDTDNDGVTDDVDLCVDTQEDEVVNGEGCAPSQLDTDNDGTNDAIDQCPATPTEETANAEGCAPSQLDTDSDGVSDDIDLCENTPGHEAPNSDGCSPSQLDSDNDSVNDALDQCPATPSGETVDEAGCALSQLDSDNDGVSDAIDQCVNSPIGESVNNEGCAATQLDSDNDGVNDALDQCPATPTGESANAEGCSRDQIDTDADGVADYLDAFPNDPNETTDLDGDGIGDNADTDRDGDGVLNELDSFPNDASESQDTDGDGVGDNTDTDIDGDGVSNEDDFFPTDPESSTVPTVQITSPASLTTVGSSPLRINGTVDDLGATIIVNGIEIPQNNGSFEADVVIEEGANNIIVRAIDSKNHEGTATVTVSLDKTPPYITIQSPTPNGKVFSDTIAVSGLVNDIVRGTVSEDEANVQVTSPLSSITASVSNRSYLAENVKLQEGENQITITASDAVGNTNSESISIDYVPQISRQIELVSGNAQTAVIQNNLDQPLIVKLSEDGAPVVDKTVIFRVTEGDGLLQPGSDAEGNGAVVRTNDQGLAQVTYKLGSRAGIGNHKVMARAVGFAGEVEFYQSASYGDGIQMGLIAGNNQRGSVRQPLPQPLVVAVTDTGANLIPNLEILFEVSSGSGRFANGESTFTTTTDMDGRASAQFTLGVEEGLDVQRVTARLVDTNARVSFTASAFLPGDPGETSISGVVLDNQDQPMPNVTLRIEGSARQAITNEQGQFSITQAPVGPVHLLVEGSTTSRAGEWPSLSYNLVTVPGVDNPMASPVYLVEIDTENAVYVGREDIIVTHPDLPGFEMEVKAGSVTFPDGSKEGNLSITRVNANKIPMAPPNGMQPQLIVTIQPHGAQFDPPARLTLPNTDGHQPLAEVEMYSYDHDLEEFVTIGLGTVSKDGATVTSNLGSGVVKAGWHCGSPPGGNGCGHDCPECNDCNEQCACEFVDNDPRIDSECQVCEKVGDKGVVKNITDERPESQPDVPLLKNREPDVVVENFQITNSCGVPIFGGASLPRRNSMIVNLSCVASCQNGDEVWFLIGGYSFSSQPRIRLSGQIDLPSSCSDSQVARDESNGLSNTIEHELKHANDLINQVNASNRVHPTPYGTEQACNSSINIWREAFLDSYEDAVFSQCMHFGFESFSTYSLNPDTCDLEEIQGFYPLDQDRAPACRAFAKGTGGSPSCAP